MRVAVAGGTGMVGKYVVAALNDSGHEPVVLSRSHGVDLHLDAAVMDTLEGVSVIIDTANTGTTRRSKATAFFSEVTTRLQQVGARQGVQRLVTLSIVGIDRVPDFGYYHAKLAQERAAMAGPLPVTILRATQFHEFPAQVLSRVTIGPMRPMPTMQIQPIAARSVGRCLVDAAIEPPTIQLLEVAGPRQENLVDLARQIAAQRGRHVRVVPVPLPGKAGRAMRKGALLATSSAKLVGPRFADWLLSDDAQYPAF